MKILSAIFLIPVVALAGDSGKKSALDPLGKMNEPLATGLNFQSFNAEPDETNDRALGEILSRFDAFLAAQKITPNDGWSRDDLEKIYRILSRDYALAKAEEKELDDRYDDLKEKWEDLEEDIEDEKDDADLPKYLRLKAEGAPIKSARNLLRDYLDFEKPILKKLDAARADPGDAKSRAEACDWAVRILYSLFADQFMTERNDEPFPKRKQDKKLIVNRFVDRAVNNSVPYEKFPHKGKLWKHGAEKEARNLVDPMCPNQFLTADELAEMSHAEVAALDVAKSNPFWHTRQQMETCPPDTWGDIENWIEDFVTADELDSKKFKEDFPDFRYDLNTARKVLFWDDVKKTATSPKVDVVDVFDREWKLKWGEESVVEPIGNRLRAKLGAKFVDLTYADVGGNAHLLILPSAIEKSMNPDQQMPLTVEEFISVMKNSRYDFNVKPFILASGKITEDNADSILKNLPEETPKKYRAKKLIGRTWIKFRESMVEAKHDAVLTGGPVSLFTNFSHHDRALRQSMLMTLWMGDTDLKEDNHRSVWIEDFGGKNGWQYLEFFHDPGSSFGGVRHSGEVNKFPARGGTGGFLWIGASGRRIHSNLFQLYRPEIWDGITFADHLAGARHIVRLTKTDLREIVSHSKMPDFWQESLVWRLAKRRDIIGKSFNLPLPDAGAGDAPSFSVTLTTRADRCAAAEKYRIPLREIENDLVRAGELSADNRSGDTAKPFEDVLVKNATIQSYFDSVLLGILRDVRHPPGFVKRMTRFNDGQEWISRRYRLKVKEPKPEKALGI